MQSKNHRIKEIIEFKSIKESKSSEKLLSIKEIEKIKKNSRKSKSLKNNLIEYIFVEITVASSGTHNLNLQYKISWTISQLFQVQEHRKNFSKLRNTNIDYAFVFQNN